MPAPATCAGFFASVDRLRSEPDADAHATAAVASPTTYTDAQIDTGAGIGGIARIDGAAIHDFTRDRRAARAIGCASGKHRNEKKGQEDTVHSKLA